MDFDGVLTDNRVIINNDGTESVICSRDDGYAIEKIRELGIHTLILSREKNNIILSRAKKLKTDIIRGEENKLAALKYWCQAKKIKHEEVAFIGNDTPDLEALKFVTYSFCPADSFSKVKETVKYVLKTKGGHGCIREIYENYIKSE